MRNFKSTILCIVASDICALLFCFMVAFLARGLFAGALSFAIYSKLLPWLLLFIPLYASMGLYPGLLLAGPEALKRLSIATTVGTLFLSGLLFVGQVGTLYSRFVILFFWVLALFFVPLLRYLTKQLCSHYTWWGYPVLLFGKANLTELLQKHLRNTPSLGYQAVGLFNIDNTGSETTITEATIVTSATKKSAAASMQTHGQTHGQAAGQAHGSLAAELPLSGKLDSIAACIEKHPKLTAVLVMNGLTTSEQKALFRLAGSCFKHIIVLPDEALNIRLSVKLSMFCSHIALSMRQNLLDPYRLHMKRFLDLLIILLFLPPLLPLLALISLLVRLDSPGSIFYRHTRIGQHGHSIKVWKFRTMQRDADKILNDYLERHPQLKEEWLREQKLKNDPRITRVGHFLRKTSLDELPQIFNVIKGEMSLVGPRPIVDDEIAKYGAAFDLYKQVKPGISGLWQVSGRNNVSYDTRVTLDETYIANWSVWLDIYILVRTVPAAITGAGAY